MEEHKILQENQESFVELNCVLLILSHELFVFMLSLNNNHAFSSQRGRLELKII